MNSRIAYFLFLLLIAWCVMLWTHEGGHLLGGWVSGAQLVKCDLWPWHLPFSFHQPDPHPLITLWAGPVLGAVVPLCVAAAVRTAATRFVAAFCLLANGSYLALAWWSGDGLLDTARLLDAGSHPIWLVFFCVASIGVGYPLFRTSCVEILRGVPTSPRDEKTAPVDSLSQAELPEMSSRSELGYTHGPDADQL